MRRLAGWIALIAGILAAAFLLLRTPDTDPAAMRARYAAPPSRFVDVGGGLFVHYRDTGPRNAPVLLLLHGSNSSLQTWDAWAARLERRYRVVRLDQIGHGLTGPNPTGRYDAAAFVGTLDRFAARVGLARFALAGNSMGGWVAWNYALAHPDRVSALILVDAAGAPSQAPSSLPIGFRVARTPVLRDLARYITPRRMIADSLRQTVSNQAIVTDAAIDRYWELLRYPGNRQATMTRFAEPHVPADAAALHRLTMPVLIEWGAQDRLITLADARWFARAIPHSRLVVYPAVGHVPMEEAADASARDVDAFLAARTH